MAVEDLLHPLLSRYMSAAPWLRAAAGHAYRQLPPRLRYGRNYARYVAEASHGLDAADVDMIERRLAATINLACARVPAYRRWRHLASDRRPAWERLRELPLVSKVDIKADLLSFLTDGALSMQAMRTFTGGSTTNPMLFYLQRATSRPRETAYMNWIDQRLLGRQPDDWVLSLRGRTVPGAARENDDWAMIEPIKRHLILSSDHLEPRFMERYVAALRRWRPRLVHAFPSALYPLARWLETHPCPEFTAGVRGVLLTSETVYGEQLGCFSRVFDAPVISHYGHSERVLMGLSAAPGEPYRFWPLYGWLELVDSQGAPIETAGVVGEIVGTSFDNGVMPFVRYRTGDLGAWAESPQPGRVQQLARIDGRLQEFVVCADRRLVSITTLGAAHFSELASAQSIQFFQNEPGKVELRVVATTPLTPRAAAAVADAIRIKTQGGCEVTVVQVTSLCRTARGKQPMLLQQLDLTPYYASGVAAGRSQHRVRLAPVSD